MFLFTFYLYVGNRQIVNFDVCIVLCNLPAYNFVREKLTNTRCYGRIINVLRWNYIRSCACLNHSNARNNADLDWEHIFHNQPCRLVVINRPNVIVDKSFEYINRVVSSRTRWTTISIIFVNFFLLQEDWCLFNVLSFCFMQNLRKKNQS